MGKVCFDFDGVIHSYTSGWLGDDIIPDPPVPGIKEAIDRLRDAGYQVVVLSSRSANKYGMEAMQDWFDYWGITVDGIYSTKPPARCYVDDRAVCFDGDPGKLFDIIDNFEPWWKQNTGQVNSQVGAAPSCLMGAIIGDIAGSIYEFDNIHDEDFPLFGTGSAVTDDTVMTVAVAQALLNAKEKDTTVYDELVAAMQYYGHMFPTMSYGTQFRAWLNSPDPQPYNSWGNGAPMRCSPAGWVTDDVSKAIELGELTALPTHNHPYAVKAAGTVAGLICMARNGASKEDMAKFTLERGYDVPSLARLRAQYTYTESSQGTMPAALSAFFSSASFEDCIRKAISIGGDSDTIAAIAGSIAEAYYGIPDDIRKEAWEYVPPELKWPVQLFEQTFVK